MQGEVFQGFEGAPYANFFQPSHDPRSCRGAGRRPGTGSPDPRSLRCGRRGHRRREIGRGGGGGSRPDGRPDPFDRADWLSGKWVSEPGAGDAPGDPGIPALAPAGHPAGRGREAGGNCHPSSLPGFCLDPSRGSSRFGTRQRHRRSARGHHTPASPRVSGPGNLVWKRVHRHQPPRAAALCLPVTGAGSRGSDPLLQHLRGSDRGTGSSRWLRLLAPRRSGTHHPGGDRPDSHRPVRRPGKDLRGLHRSGHRSGWHRSAGSKAERQHGSHV